MRTMHLEAIDLDAARKWSPCSGMGGVLHWLVGRPLKMFTGCLEMCETKDGRLRRFKSYEAAARFAEKLNKVEEGGGGNG